MEDVLDQHDRLNGFARKAPSVLQCDVCGIGEDKLCLARVRNDAHSKSPLRLLCRICFDALAKVVPIHVEELL